MENTMEKVTTLNGLCLEMQLLSSSDEQKLFIHQERLCITDLSNNELFSKDILSYLQEDLGISETILDKYR
jgi:hypothetical protein